jgi:signal transduction histidine kinase
MALQFDRPLRAERIGQSLNALATAHGDRLIHYKGVLNIAGLPQAQGGKCYVQTTSDPNEKDNKLIYLMFDRSWRWMGCV